MVWIDFPLEREECRALRDRLDRAREALAEDESGPSPRPAPTLPIPRHTDAEPLTLRDA